jgi:hypothetical protein
MDKVDPQGMKKWICFDMDGVICHYGKYQGLDIFNPPNLDVISIMRNG